MTPGTDHIAILVRDFDATVANYETLFGRVPNWRGFMPGARHAWFQFPGMALDIIAATGTGPEADAARLEMEKHGDAIWGLGFSVPDLDSAIHLSERRGLAFLPRHTTVTKSASGTARSWELAVMKRKSANGVALFLVENKADAAKWPVATATDAEDAAVGGLKYLVIETANARRAGGAHAG